MTRDARVCDVMARKGLGWRCLQQHEPEDDAAPLERRRHVVREFDFVPADRDRFDSCLLLRRLLLLLARARAEQLGIVYNDAD